MQKVEEYIPEPMTATEVQIRMWLVPVLNDVQKRIDLCERIFGKIMQLDARLDTLEFNSTLPSNPSAAEKFMDFEMRVERLESYLLNGDKK